MKLMVTRILLWTGWFATFSAGVNLLGLGLFASTTESRLGVALANQQILAVLGGRGRILAMAAICVLISIGLQKWLRQVRQAEGDAKARQILSEVREDKPPSMPYFLYLRAFETTKNLTAPLFLLNLATFGLNRLWSGELEGFVSTALRKVGPLIALGHPGENFGAGRVTTSDEEWMSDITKLARNAYGILLIPSHRPGTLWEIEHLEREGLLSRTVFVMPPESRRFGWRSHWGQARRAMGPLGAALPEYESLGMLFTLDAAHAVRGVEPFSLFIRRGLRKSVLRLLGTQVAPVDPAVTDKAIRKARRKSARWRLFWVVDSSYRALGMAFLTVVVLVGAGHSGPRPQPLPWPAFWDQFMNSATIEERRQSIEGYFDDSAAYRTLAKPLFSGQEAELRAEMTHAGFRRLDNRQLRDAYLAFNQLLQRADVPTCGAIAQGTLAADQMDRALVKLDPDKLENWMDMNREAAIAEIKEKPVPEVSYGELVEARRGFEESLKPDELNQYRALAQRNATRTIEDECWLARKKYAAVSTLPEPRNLAWSRLLEFEQEKPAMHALVKDPFARLKTLAAFQERTKGMTEQQVSDLFGDLVGKGLARLDDLTLLGRLRAFSDVLEKADESTCEAIAQGTSSTDQFEAALGNIPESGQAAFLDSQFRAAVAELQQQAKPTLLSKAEKEMVGEKFAGLLSPKELAQFSSAASSHKCWMLRKDFAAVNLLDEPYNRMWARNLAQQ